MKITQENIEWLVRNARLKSLYDNTYLYDENNENFRYIKRRFFRYENYETVCTLNVGTGLFPTVADVSANYTGNPIADNNIDLIDCTRDYNIYNFCTIGLTIEQEDGKSVAKTSYLPAEGWFYQDGKNHIARVYRKSINLGQVDYYMLIQCFYDTYTESKLYRMPTGFSVSRSTALNFDNLEEVSLDTIEQTTGMQEIMQHPFGKPALFMIRKDKNVLYPE